MKKLIIPAAIGAAFYYFFLRPASASSTAPNWNTGALPGNSGGSFWDYFNAENLN